MPARTYKIRAFANGKSKRGKEFMNYSLTVPAAIAAELPKDLQFECLLTDDGILFRPSTTNANKAPAELPAWAQAKAAKKTATRKRPAAQAA